MSRSDDIPRLCGDEPFKTGGNPGQSLKFGTVRDFWSWSSSELSDNTLRGVLGEYYVALALSPDDPFELRMKAWSSWDLQTPGGLRIEVKTSGRRQSWDKNPGRRRKKRSPYSPKWGVSKSKVYCEDHDEYSKSKCRPAHLYVLCMHTQTDVDKIDARDLTQWKFYVLATKVLNEKVNQSTKDPKIGLRFLQQNDIHPVCFDQLERRIQQIVNESDFDLRQIDCWCEPKSASSR